jgi:hypothetical protein
MSLGFLGQSLTYNFGFFGLAASKTQQLKSYILCLFLFLSILEFQIVAEIRRYLLIYGTTFWIYFYNLKLNTLHARSLVSLVSCSIA